MNMFDGYKFKCAYCFHKTQSSQLKSIEREMLNQVDVIKHKISYSLEARE